jgi:hypothetical protein
MLRLAVDGVVDAQQIELERTHVVGIDQHVFGEEQRALSIDSSCQSREQLAQARTHESYSKISRHVKRFAETSVDVEIGLGAGRRPIECHVEPTIRVGRWQEAARLGNRLEIRPTLVFTRLLSLLDILFEEEVFLGLYYLSSIGQVVGAELTRPCHAPIVRATSFFFAHTREHQV